MKLSFLRNPTVPDRPADRRLYFHSFLFALGAVSALPLSSGLTRFFPTDPVISAALSIAALVLISFVGLSLLGRLLVPILEILSGLLLSLNVLYFTSAHALSSSMRAVSLLFLFLFIFCFLTVSVRSCEFSRRISRRLMPESSFRSGLRAYAVVSVLFILVPSSLLLLLVRFVCGDTI